MPNIISLKQKPLFMVEPLKMVYGLLLHTKKVFGGNATMKVDISKVFDILN